MHLLTRVRTSLLSWWQDAPLPTLGLDQAPSFQSWHEFDALAQAWVPISTKNNRLTPKAITTDRGTMPGPDKDRNLVLVTWNIDSFAPKPSARISAIISHILGQNSPADIIFLQEVSRPALTSLLQNPRIRQIYFSSEADDASWKDASFATMTLLSKASFAYPKDRSKARIRLGPVWRVNYSSRFGRDALCCDIIVSNSQAKTSRIRLINVHLDSLPILPSLRPQQISIAASLLQSAGRGLIAGDFNPVLPEDDALITDHGLIDAWVQTHGTESGFTWGIDGKAPFPPARLDKIAVTGLDVQEVTIEHPGIMEPLRPPRSLEQVANNGQNMSKPLCWSDHCGLRCLLEPL